MAEDKVFTQEEVNKLVGQARLEGKDAGRKEFEGWISPEDFEKQKLELTDKVKTLSDEQEKLQAQLTEKDGKIAKYEIDSVKTRVARETGLSFEAIAFLQGDSEEAIRESAKNLKAIVGNGQTAPLFKPESEQEYSSTDRAFKEMLENLGGN